MLAHSRTMYLHSYILNIILIFINALHYTAYPTWADLQIDRSISVINSNVLCNKMRWIIGLHCRYLTCLLISNKASFYKQLVDSLEKVEFTPLMHYLNADSTLYISFRTCVNLLFIVRMYVSASPFEPIETVPCISMRLPWYNHLLLENIKFYCSFGICISIVYINRLTLLIDLSPGRKDYWITNKPV